MKLVDMLVVGVGSAVLIKAIKKNKKEKEEEEKRKNTECFFDEIVTSDVFAYMVALISKDIKRLTAYNKGPVVYGRVESQTGKTSWSFSLDFNDYGRITGRYWKTAENYDSNIPDRIGDIMSALIKELHNSKSVDDSYYEYRQQYDDFKNEKDEYEPNDMNENEVEKEKIKAKQEAERRLREEKAAARRKKMKAFRKKHWKAYLISILVICLALFGVYEYWQFSKLRVVGVSSYSVIDKNYEDIENKLTEKGFTDILVVPESDLDGQNLQQENLISEITINDKSDFDKDDKFPYDAEIVIHYHSAKIVAIPFSSKEIKGMNYKELKQELKDLGFVNIELKKDEDLVFGWINKNGEIESISVDGVDKFDSNYHTGIDSKIVIIYHTYKSKK